MGEKLTPAQVDLLRALRDGSRVNIHNESIVKSLGRKGLAERFVDRFAYTANRHEWRITDAGRAALSRHGEGK